ncbi:hypothetical protein HMPREF0973_02360 [Prevotella veroralis F0319]|uniref:Uncharacterized protein n=1 Tax=Prevotella veroralis F0319 TaxID=649761 RepID=C9MRU7_9BACT|nr:hypothetical protein HMPREF0973_02360 [Prevotella veroralis F0319]
MAETLKYCIPRMQAYAERVCQNGHILFSTPLYFIYRIIRYLLQLCR